MNSLSKVIVLFAVLGVLGAGLFFYPGSPFHYTKIIVVQEGNAQNVAESAEAPAESEPASGEPATEMNQ